MNTSKLADIAEITSSIAIMVTLVFLVVQMQQNTEALRANALQEALAQDLEHLRAIVSNPEIISNRGATELTDEEEIQIGYHLVAYFRMREQDWLQYQNGVLDKTAWEAYRRPIPNTLSTRRARDWWRDVSPIIYDPSFVVEINELIADIPVNNQDLKLFWAD